jgi:hypothetical protein
MPVLISEELQSLATNAGAHMCEVVSFVAGLADKLMADDPI